MEKVEALVLWHYFELDGRFKNALITRFSGTMSELQDMLHEKYNENKRGFDQKTLTVPHQIIILSYEP